MDLLGPDSSLGVRERLYQLLCLIASFFAICVIAPGDLLEHLPVSLATGVLCFGLLFLVTFWLARRRGIYAYWTLFFVVAALLNFAWFLNAGSSGPTTSIFLAAAMIFAAMFRSWKRWLAAAILTADLVALYLFEMRTPALIAQYATPALRHMDMVLTVPLAISMSVLMMVAILSAYEAERLHLARSRSSLEATLREIRTLKGLLPICSSCKKIRTDTGEWMQLERYISQHSEAEFSHGLCPKCMDVYLPKVAGKKN